VKRPACASYAASQNAGRTCENCGRNRSAHNLIERDIRLLIAKCVVAERISGGPSAPPITPALSKAAYGEYRADLHQIIKIATSAGLVTMTRGMLRATAEGLRWLPPEVRA